MDNPDYEAEYNNSAKVPNAPAILARWSSDAAAFRAAQPHAEIDIAYGPSPRQVLDLFWPDSSRGAPLALFIHGGYWQRLDKSWVSHLARGLLAHDIAVAVPSYDLCPFVPLADIAEQIRACAGFLMARHQRGIFATGHSAGGHLAAMLLATDWPARGLPALAVPGAVAFSGLFDLTPLVDTTINTALGLTAADARRQSPVLLPPPPGRLHAIVGGLEGAEYERQSRDIAAAWAGTWEILPDRNHFDVVAPLSEPASAVVIGLAASVRESASRPQ